MAANPKPLEMAGPAYERYHVYHAEAQVISGSLKHPLKQPIDLRGRAVIEKSRRDDHISQSLKATSLEGLISFAAAYTRASGSKIEKKDVWGNDHSGWVTLSTSVIEGLNVLEVITADRVVAQVSTEHPVAEGHVPKVTFLGTRFENLRVGGYPVEVDLDLGICGERPGDDRPYLEDNGFLDRVERQFKGIATSKGLPGELGKQYDGKIRYIDDLRTRVKGRAPGTPDANSDLLCSLVKSIGPIPIPGVKTYGNIIVIPDFGTVSLGEIELRVESSHDVFSDKMRASSPPQHGSNYFTLHMLNMNLGCIAGGQVTAASTTVNGQTHP